jgi:sphingomyelin phosphodiesterase
MLFTLSHLALGLLIGPICAIAFSTNNTNSTLPTRGGPQLVYAGQYGVPPINATSPQPPPLQFNATQIAAFAEAQIDGIIASHAFEGNCSKCIASVEVVKFLALAYPAEVPPLLINLCKKYQFTDNTTCEMKYASSVLGAYLTQIAARLNVGTDDIQLACAFELGGWCPTPNPVPINESAWFSKPKPASANVAPPDSGKMIRVIHISDTHWDSRYDVGAEGNCTDYSMCCRADSVNSNSPNSPLSPAARYGNYGCDVPSDLMLSIAYIDKMSDL